MFRLFNDYDDFVISNDNMTEWSPIRSVIILIPVITKSDVRFVYHEYHYRPSISLLRV